jgi:hypothetical protein
MPTTTRAGLRYPLLTDTPDVPRDIGNIAADADGTFAMYTQGTLASRPTSTSGSPGKAGRIYYGTDTLHLYYDFGTGWSDIGPSSSAIADGSITGGPAGAGVKIAAATITHDNMVAGTITTTEILDGTIAAADLAAALKPSGGAGSGTESLRALGTAAGTAAAGTHASQHSRTGADPVVISTFISSGTLASRPSTSLVAGMIYTATDVGGGTTYLYNGSSWIQMGSAVTIAGATITQGVLASRPAASASSGSMYYATDQDVMYLSNGTVWSRVNSMPAGATVLWYNSVAPTGWVLYNGGTLGGSTGIYADLYTHLGSTTTLPDFRGRMPIGLGTHTDVATIGNNEGQPTVGSRRGKHYHPTLSAQKTSNANEGNGTAVFVMKDGSTENTTTSTPPITVGPSSAAPADSSGYMTVCIMAHL